MTRTWIAPAFPEFEAPASVRGRPPVGFDDGCSISAGAAKAAIQDSALSNARSCELIPFPGMGAERDLRPSDRIKLLFVCPTHSILSPMADGLARADYTRLNISVQSAGLTADPLDPEAVGVMAEIGIDIGGIPSTAVRGLHLDAFDIVVSLGMHKLGIGRHQMAIAWDIPKFQRLRQPRAAARLREVRNALSARIRGLGAVLTATHRA